MIATAISLDSPDPVTDLAINLADFTVDITIDKALILEGLKVSFTLSGYLVSYPTVTHIETFELKFYTFECQSE